MTNKCRQKLPWIALLLFCHCSFAAKAPENVSHEEDVKEDLSEAEAKDGQLEIIKTIKKINEDGSYTIGYEADDGSFKIESRDVQGNVKGTYGYVDEDGEIKRVSYSSTNFSDIISEPPSVVQRIPKVNRTIYIPSTRKPGILLYSPTTPSTPSSTSVIQTIPKRRVATQSTTTPSPTTTTHKSERPSSGDYVKSSVDVLRSTTTRPPNVVYATSLPTRQIYFPQRSLLRSTVPPRLDVQKSEGQIIRPEIVTARSTELPAFRRLTLKSPILENEASTIKPVTEEPEVRGNLLRRQLSQEKPAPFDPRQHILTLQQGLGEDSVDVYSASLTTGTPRPLFTTTHRPRVLPSAAQVVTTTQTSKAPQTTENVQEATTTENSVTEATSPASAPVYQIPPAHPLVAIKHPFHGGVVLVPYNQIRHQEVEPPVAQPQYVLANGPLFRPTHSPQHPQNPSQVIIQRPPILRSIPVQVDENGYVRPLQQHVVTPTPYPAQIPITPPPRAVENDVESEVESIKPPVSTRDFQKLIELLILRQRRLEHVNALLISQRQRELQHQHRFRIIPQPTPVPILIRHPQEVSHNGPVTFVPAENLQRTQYVTIPNHPRAIHQEAQAQSQQPTYIVKPQTQESREVYVQESPVTYTSAPAEYTPTKRVARLLHPSVINDQGIAEEYLPPQIREMLLLRMLQLAINPALPLDVPDNVTEEDSTPSEQQIKKTGVRNVEVLGEESEEQKRSRSKRFSINYYAE